MDKIAKGIGYITIMYVGLYLLDAVAVNTGADKVIEKITAKMLKTDSEATKEVNKVELGFH